MVEASTVDAYGEAEQATGWHCVIEGAATIAWRVLSGPLATPGPSLASQVHYAASTSSLTVLDSRFGLRSPRR